MNIINKGNSQGFLDILGPRNVPHSISNSMQHQIRAALVELRCREDDKRQPTAWMPEEVKRKWQEHPNSLRALNGYRGGKHFKRFTQAHADIRGQRECDSVNELASQFGYDTQFDAHSKKFKTPQASFEASAAPNGYRFFCIPEAFSLSSGTYRWAGHIPIHAQTGNVIGALLRYEAENGKEFLLPAKIIKGKDHPRLPEEPLLVPGRLVPPYFLLWEHLLEEFSESTVFLCYDPLVAEGMDRMIQDSKRFARGTYIATASGGGYGTVAHADLRGLYDKDVVYVCSPDRESFTAAVECHKKFLETEVRSFKILLAPVLRSPLETEHGDIGSLSDPWERRTLKAALVLSDYESILLKRMQEQAVSFEEFTAWGIEVGLFSGEGDSMTTSRMAVSYEPPTEQEINSIKHEKISVDVFASEKQIGAIIADTHAGKTQAAIGLAVAWSASVPFWGFEAVPQSRVLYIDAETENTPFKVSIARQVSALGANSETVKKNLRYCCLREEGCPQDWDLSSPDFQGRIENEIKTSHARLVILDNLMNLTPKSGKIDEATWNKIWQWMRAMEQKYGVAFLIIHHTNVDGASAGTKNIERQCSNIVSLTKVADLANRKNGLPENSPLAEYIGKSGVLALVTVKKCRKYPDALNMQFGTYLAYDKSSPASGAPWDRIEQNPTCPQGAVEPENHEGDKIIELGQTADQRKILSLFASHKELKCKQVEAALKCKHSKAQGVLKAMVEQGILDLVGKSRAAKYLIRKD